MHRLIGLHKSWQTLWRPASLHHPDDDSLLLTAHLALWCGSLLSVAHAYARQRELGLQGKLALGSLLMLSWLLLHFHSTRARDATAAASPEPAAADLGSLPAAATPPR